MLLLHETCNLIADIHSVSQRNTTASNNSMNVNAKRNRESRPSTALQMQPLFTVAAVILLSIMGWGGGLAGRVEGGERTSAEPCAPPPLTTVTIQPIQTQMKLINQTEPKSDDETVCFMQTLYNTCGHETAHRCEEEAKARQQVLARKQIWQTVSRATSALHV